jgi:adenine-specific DNA-methyltransferase
VRLELTWPGKDQFLLGSSSATGKPVWVPRDHPAALEVRLADFTGIVGDPGQPIALDEPATGRTADQYGANLLFTGDSLDVLRILNEVPEYRRHYRGQVRCAFIDPPFNTGQQFEHYDDWMEHSTWLSFMRDRLMLLRELLTPDGTLWLHLDNTEVHRMRCLLDEVMGAENYLATVIWQRTSAKSLARKTMGTMHEAILVYGRSATSQLKSLFTPLDDAYVAKRYTNTDGRGRYDTGDLTATSFRPHLDSGKAWRGHDPSARRRCWAVPTAPLLEAGMSPAELDLLTMREKLDALDAASYIHWPEAGGFPRFKKYLHNAKGRAVGDLWTDITVINSQAGERTGFSTQKPEALLQRVLQMATDPGDIVVDCFGGSATTAAVAHKMGRRWVTCEVLPETVSSFIRPRLESVVDGTDTSGISIAVGWAGGGGFRQVGVGESMYAVTPVGVVLSDAATNGRFARAVAGQLGFEWQPDSAPLCGARGRMRLAVIDGAVGAEEIAHVVGALGDNERVTVVAKAVLPDAETALAKLSPGSRLRKAPRDLLSDGARRAKRTGAA